MKENKLLLFFMCGLLVLAMFSCSKDSTGPEENEDSVVKEETKLIESDELQAITEVSEDEIVFSGNSVSIDTYQAGDVLVSAPSDVAEFGFLRMVDDISQNGNDIVVTTSQARLEDAFEELHFDISEELRSTDIKKSTQLMEGVQFIENSRDPYEFEYELNVTIPISNNIDIEIDGNLLLTMGFDFDIDISLLNGLYYIKAGGHSTADSDLQLSINGEFSYENEFELYEHTFAPGFTYLTPTVPPIPIVFVPKVVILLDINADGEASISTYVTSDASIEAGLIYDKPDWSSYTDKEINFDYNPPSLTASLSAYAAAGPRFELNLYNIAGPYVKPMGYLDMEADIQNTPWWSLYGGYKVDAGVKFEILGYVQDYEIEDIINYNYLIAEASNSNGIIYGDFAITELTYDDASDWEQIVDDIFGSGYRVVDWNDLVAFHNDGGDLLDLYDGLGMTEHGNSAYVTRDGDHNYSSTRYYFASRHEHNKPGNYLAHENIDNYLISLGSWDGSNEIFAVKVTFCK